MTERGKVWRDRAQSPFPEEEMVHSHACCWMDGARNSSLVIVRDAAPDAGDDLGPFQRIGRGDLFGMTAGEIHADRYGAEDAANFTDEGGQS
jgi:hypothetical protein